MNLLCDFCLCLWFGLSAYLFFELRALIVEHVYQVSVTVSIRNTKLGLGLGLGLGLVSVTVRIRNTNLYSVMGGRLDG